MDKKNPKDIIDSVEHLTNIAKASIEVNDLLQEFKNLPKTNLKDIENLKNRAISHLNLSVKQYEAGLLSEQEFMFFQFYSINCLLHESSWTNGNYSEELEPLSEKMRSIEKANGLKSDEYWKIDDAPPEYQELNRQYEEILDSKLEGLVIEFAHDKVEKLFMEDRKQFEALSELGRKSIFIDDDIKRLGELVQIYEKEAEINENGRAFLSASIMLAAAMEARLIVQCSENRDEVRKILTTMGLTKKKLKSKNPLDWDLDILIDVCSSAGWLRNFETKDFLINTKNFSHSLRSTRNLVHPGVHVKKRASLEIGEQQFKNIKMAYNIVVQQFNFPNSEDQNFNASEG